MGQQAIRAELGLPKLRRNTLRDEVDRELRQALISGRIAPGSTITIRGLAASFGTSPMPVREALQQLIAEGILTATPNRSASVPVMNAARFRELLRIRLELEGLAAEAATPLISQEDLRRLERLDAAMERHAAPQSFDFLEMNRDFHLCLYEAARLPILLSIIESLWLQMGALLWLERPPASADGQPQKRLHQRLLHALRKRAADEVREVLVRDIGQAGKHIIRRLEAAQLS